MKKPRSSIWFVLGLVVLSTVIYAFQIAQFHAVRETEFYFFQDLAFLPIQVALVTVVLGTVLKDREKRERIRKIRIVIGAFFSEAGNELLRELLRFFPGQETLARELEVSPGWTSADYRRARDNVRKTKFGSCAPCGDLNVLRKLLAEKRSFLLGVLSNPSLLEHDTFTDMIWAVLHLTDELLARTSLTELPHTDLAHLEGDLKRALRALLEQWVSHMEHLQREYPYLFSLEVRRNPLLAPSDVTVRE